MISQSLAKGNIFHKRDRFKTSRLMKNISADKNSLIASSNSCHSASQVHHVGNYFINKALCIQGNIKPAPSGEQNHQAH